MEPGPWNPKKFPKKIPWSQNIYQDGKNMGRMYFGISCPMR
jgi:hypothetical protein